MTRRRTQDPHQVAAETIVPETDPAVPGSDADVSIWIRISDDQPGGPGADREHHRCGVSRGRLAGEHYRSAAAGPRRGGLPCPALSPRG